MFDQVESAHKWSPIILRSYPVFLILSTASIAIRLVAKFKTKANFGLDDAFIVAAEILFYVEAGLNMYAAHLGKSLVSMLDQEYAYYTKWPAISGMVYAPVVLCISVSVLLFYRRIFPVKQVKRLVDIFLVIHVLWTLAMFFGSIFICWPIKLIWAPVMVQAVNMDKCMKYPEFFVSILSIELGLNAAVLLMPIKQVFGLQMSLQTRLMLMLVFLLGGVSLISGIVRVQQTYVPGDPYIDLAGDMFWYGVHVSTALVAASLPIYRPLMRASMGFMSSTLRKVYGSGYDSKRSAGSSSAKTSEGYSTISDKHSQKSLVTKDHSNLDTIDRDIGMINLQPTKPEITVERSYEVV